MSKKRDNDNYDNDLLIKDRDKLHVQKPKKYKVVFHNDDFTTVDFVCFIIMSVFNKGIEEAYRITMDIHEKGKGIAGIYSKEIAETKSEKVNAVSKTNGFPLLTTIEPE